MQAWLLYASFVCTHGLRAHDNQTLPFEKVQHKVTTLDAQPSDPTMSNMIVSVTGLLLVRYEAPPLLPSRSR